MKKISVKPVWTIHSDEHGALSPRLIELLAEVHRAGSYSVPVSNWVFPIDTAGM
ncbi:MAG: hypothetical protein IPF38_13295 [Burkholderiales bacterium]|nr:hypothetical protein [Burkholderiales bacterium]